MNRPLHVDGTLLTIRPVETGDLEDLARMFRKLSHESTYYRFFSPLPRVPEPTLRRMIDVDHCRCDAVVAVDGTDIVGIANYDTPPQPASREAEVAIVIHDDWQRRGVGQRLMCSLAALAFSRDYDTFLARTLPSNRAAIAFVRKLSPRAVTTFAGGEYEVRLGVDELACERPVRAGCREEMRWS